MSARTVAVIGGGTMGSGIAQTFAQGGYETLLIDVEQRFVDRALGGIEKSLAKFVEKGKISAADKDATLARLRGGTDLDATGTALLVVEAVPEIPDLKKKTFQRVGAVASPTAILATNTSSIPITELATVVPDPSRFIGMHFMNPVPLMALVEIIRGMATSDDTTNRVVEMAKGLGKTPVVVRDFPGFVSNRVLLPMINEAVFALMEGVATRESIDTVMKLGMNHPMGPLALADLIGLDVCLDILVVLHEGFGDSKYRPCPLLRQMVQAGWLGRKSGRGFYEYA
ncbi:MAG: 3-hydroxybutyryl-CoA dehydrogenase [bacterium]